VKVLVGDAVEFLDQDSKSNGHAFVFLRTMEAGS